MRHTVEVDTKETGVVTNILLNMLGELKNHELVLLLRRRLNMSQFDICAQTGIKPQELSTFEQGKKHLSNEDLINIIKVLQQRSDSCE